MTIFSSRNKNEIIQFLKGEVNKNSSFSIKENGNGCFEFSRKINYRNSFLPVIKIKVLHHHRGSSVNITMRLHAFVIIFLSIWIYFVFPFMPMIFLALLISIVGYNYEAYKAKKTLEEMFCNIPDDKIEDINIKPKIDSKPGETEIFELIFLLGILNFITFFVFCIIIGGDAASGFVKDGQYFVADHGKYTEVYEYVWKINKLHGSSIFITHPLAMIAGILYHLTKNSKN